MDAIDDAELIARCMTRLKRAAIRKYGEGCSQSEEWADAEALEALAPSVVTEAVARRIQLWWMTQKHEPMHQNDALDLAKAAILAMTQAAQSAGERDVL